MVIYIFEHFCWTSQRRCGRGSWGADSRRQGHPAGSAMFHTAAARDPQQRAGGGRSGGAGSRLAVPPAEERAGEGEGRGDARGARGRGRPRGAGRPRVAGRWRAAAGGGAATSWRRRPGPLSALRPGAGSPRPPPCPIRPASKVTAPGAARGRGAPGRLPASQAGWGTSRAGVGPGGKAAVLSGQAGPLRLSAFSGPRRTRPASLPARCDRRHVTDGPEIRRSERNWFRRRPEWRGCAFLRPCL